MKPILERINQSLKKNRFAVVQIYGSAGSGKTVLKNYILNHFSDYDIRNLHDLRPLKETYIDNMIEVIDDTQLKMVSQNRTTIRNNVVEFYTKPRLLVKNLIRIVVVGRRIEYEHLFPIETYKDWIIDLTTGYMYGELPIDAKRTRSIFADKLESTYKRRLKTRPYLITTPPLVIGRYNHERQNLRADKQ